MRLYDVVLPASKKSQNSGWVIETETSQQRSSSMF